MNPTTTQITPERTRLAIGDVVAGTRWWAADSGSRPVAFMQVVRFTPKQVKLVELPHVVVAEFAGGTRRSQDGYDRVMAEPLTGEELERALADRGRHRTGRLFVEHPAGTEPPAMADAAGVTIIVNHLRDTTLRLWDGEPLLRT
ncbi:hypothetical protein ACXET9_03635 [Brachybacterium sp. DNPG3]